MLADVFQSFPPRKFRQSAADPPWSEADCRGTYLVRRVRGGFRVGNFYSAKKFFCRIPPRRRSDPFGPTRTQADSIGVRRGIVPPLILPNRGVREVFVGGHLSSELFRQFAAESARIRPYPRGVRRSPPNVRRTFGGVRRKIFLADVRRIRAEPGGVRAYPRGFARIRGGSSSAEPIAEKPAQNLKFAFKSSVFFVGILRSFPVLIKNPTAQSFDELTVLFFK